MCGTVPIYATNAASDIKRILKLDISSKSYVLINIFKFVFIEKGPYLNCLQYFCIVILPNNFGHINLEQLLQCLETKVLTCSGDPQSDHK